MRSALTADELTLLRTGIQSTRLYVAVHKPTSLFTAQVAGAVTYPLSQIAFDGGSGSNVLAGATIWIGSTAGTRDKGMLRLRKALTAGASGNLDVAELGQYAIDIDDNDHLTVVEDYRVAAKYPRYASGQWYMDYDVAYDSATPGTNNYKPNEEYGPMARIGPAGVGFLESNVCILRYVGERGAAYTSGKSISTYAWAFPGSASPASSASQGTAASPIEVTYGAALASGRYHSLTVTEADTLKTHVRRGLTFVFERSGANAPFDAELIGGVSGGPEAGGDRVRLRVINTTADQDDFPDGAHVVLFEEAIYADDAGQDRIDFYWYLTNVSGTFQADETVTGGTTGATGTVISVTATLMKIRTTLQFHAGEVITGGTSLATARLRSPTVGGNYPWRTNVVLEGWIIDETVHKDPATGEIEFEIATVDETMRASAGYPVTLTNRSNSANLGSWEDFWQMTLDRAALHFYKWRSTLSEVVDCTLHGDLIAGSPAATEVIKYCDMDAGDLLTQVRTWYERTMFGWVTSDMQSALYGEIDAQIDDTVRAGVPTAWTVAEGDRRGRLEIHRRSHRDFVAQVTLYGADYRTPLGSRSPDDPHGYQGDLEEITEGVAAVDQATLNLWAGNLRARRNNLYPNVPHLWRGNWRADAVPQSWIVESLAAGDTTRGIVWSSQKFLLRGLALEYDSRSGRLWAGSDCEAETQGLGGATITFPEPDPPEFVPPPEPVVPGPEPLVANATHVIFARANAIITGAHYISHIYWSGDFFQGGGSQPTWNEIATPNPTNIGHADLVVARDGSAIYLMNGDSSVSKHRIWKCTNWRSASPTWTVIWTDGDSIPLGNGVLDTFWSYPKIVGKSLYVAAQDTAGTHTYFIAKYNATNWLYSTLVGWPGGLVTVEEAVGADEITHPSGDTMKLRNPGNTQIGSSWTDFGGLRTRRWFWRNSLGGPRYIVRRHTDSVWKLHRIIENDDVLSGFNVPAENNLQIRQVRGALEGTQIALVDWDSVPNPDAGTLYLSEDGASFAAGTTWLPGWVEPAHKNGGDTLVWVANEVSANGEAVRISTDGGDTWSQMNGNIWTLVGAAALHIKNAWLIFAS